VRCIGSIVLSVQLITMRSENDVHGRTECGCGIGEKSNNGKGAVYNILLAIRMEMTLFLENLHY
jgi:hypothetical protein